MKSDAYRHASGGQTSPELVKLARIDRYGLEAVTGRRVLYLHEIRRMTYAENILHAYLSREQSDNWAGWAIQNPTSEQVLNEAAMLYAQETEDA